MHLCHPQVLSLVFEYKNSNVDVFHLQMELGWLIDTYAQTEMIQKLLCVSGALAALLTDKEKGQCLQFSGELKGVLSSSLKN